MSDVSLVSDYKVLVVGHDSTAQDVIHSLFLLCFMCCNVFILFCFSSNQSTVNLKVDVLDVSLMSDYKVLLDSTVTSSGCHPFIADLIVFYFDFILFFYPVRVLSK